MHTPTYTIAYVNALIEVAREYKIAPESILEHGGIAQEQLFEVEGLVSQPQLLTMFQATAMLSGNDSIGLDVGKLVRPGLFSELGYALKSCSNLAEAMQVSQKHQPTMMGQGKVSIESHDQSVTMHWKPLSRSPQLLRPLNESITASWLYFGRMITGLKIHPQHVTFCHPKPASTSAYKRLFNCPMEFGSETNSMTIPIELLATPLLESDPLLKTLMLTELEKRGAKIQPRDLEEVTERWVNQNLNHSENKMSLLSDTLHMSNRTLRRKLKHSGLTFRDMKVSIQKEKACSLLAQTDLPISKIADELGFSSSSYFCQAFRRWYGLSPSKWRLVKKQQ